MTPSVRDAILDADSDDDLGDAIGKGRDQYGTQTFDQSLADLVTADDVAFDMAVKLAGNPLDLELQLKRQRVRVRWLVRELVRYGLGRQELPEAASHPRTRAPAHPRMAVGGEAAPPQPQAR
jgi:hypothetical protein